eukprot:scaffold140254_cov133-Phaeocystis_antarctica.AAC.4
MQPALRAFADTAVQTKPVEMAQTLQRTRDRAVRDLWWRVCHYNWPRSWEPATIRTPYPAPSCAARQPRLEASSHWCTLAPRDATIRQTRRVPSRAEGRQREKPCQRLAVGCESVGQIDILPEGKHGLHKAR